MSAQNPIVIPLIVVPSLNEAEHIGGLLSQLRKTIDRIGGCIVVADGGSEDGTRDIVAEQASIDPRIVLLSNGERVQSAGINQAVREYGSGATHLIRIDAHCRYPDDYCDKLLGEMTHSGADSVVVSMIAEGQGGVQSLAAAAQNAPIGNGGSSHRMLSKGRFVDHGHHALFRLSAFRDVGGYDPSFSHNEDAELDLRLRQAGYRIWLTSDPVVTYFPRRGFGALARQYFAYGRGRARTLIKHAHRPKLRQNIVMLVLPALLLASFAGLQWAMALPAALWLAACLTSSALLAARHCQPSLALAAIPAILMHVAWSAGFWRQVAGYIFSPNPPKSVVR